MNDPDIDSMEGLPGDCSDILTEEEHKRLCKCYRLADEAETTAITGKGTR